MLSPLRRYGFRLRMTTVVISVAWGMAGGPAFAQGGGGLFGGLFRGRTSAPAVLISGIIPIMEMGGATALTPAITSTAITASMAILALKSRAVLATPVTTRDTADIHHTTATGLPIETSPPPRRSAPCQPNGVCSALTKSRWFLVAA